MKPSIASRPSVTPVTRRGAESGVVCLVGFMGAGKTSVGKLLSRRLGWPFEDLDDRIEAREGHSIAKIFRDSGEAEFRRAEHAALRELLSEAGDAAKIVALGGGAFAQPENLTLLEKSGASVVFLDGTPEELFRRCELQAISRPLRRDPVQFRDLYEQRRPSYMAAAWRVDTNGKDLETVAAEVAGSLGLQP